jgi:hypothetical protein
MNILDDAMREPDHHKWNARVGDQVLKSSSSVWEILSKEWCRMCLSPEDRDYIAEGILQTAHSR